MRASSSFSVTGPVDRGTATAVEAQLAALDDTGIRYRGPLQPRSAEELWRFLIDVDWASVRDNLVAAAVGAGATGIGMSIKNGYRRLGKSVSAASRELAAPLNGTIVIRDVESSLHIEIDVKSAADDQPWDALAAGAGDSVKWDPDSKRWVPRG